MSQGGPTGRAQPAGRTGAETEIFLWDLGLNEWIFLNESSYRWVYIFGTNSGWIFTFDENTPQSRFFQRFDDGSLFSVPAGLTPD